MPAKGPRITVTLNEEDYDAIKRLSKAQGVPMSRILREMIGELTPVLETLADTLEAAATMEETAVRRFREAAERAEGELAPMMRSVMDEFEAYAAHAIQIARSAGDDDQEEATAAA